MRVKLIHWYKFYTGIRFNVIDSEIWKKHKNKIRELKLAIRVTFYTCI